MKKKMKTLVFIVVCVLSTSCMAAESCPEVDPALQAQLDNLFPLHTLADKTGTTGEKKNCPNITEIGTEGYTILLKGKNANEYLILYAPGSYPPGEEEISLQVVDTLSNVFPVIETAKGGFYNDLITQKNFSISRGSVAFTVTLPDSDQVYIYKLSNCNDFTQYKIK